MKGHNIAFKDLKPGGGYILFRPEHFFFPPRIGLLLFDSPTPLNINSILIIYMFT
jgi:hypothetical protein